MTIQEQVEKLLTIKRVNDCTEMDNVDLVQKLDRVVIGKRYTQEALNALIKAIQGDMDWNHFAYTKADKETLRAVEGPLVKN